MLRGEKPLASFADAEGGYPLSMLRYLRMFDRHVAAGQILRRDSFDQFPGRPDLRLHRILYALPGEEWRMEAMIELMRSPVWGATEERREGELLGYADWMNDWWIGQRYPVAPTPAASPPAPANPPRAERPSAR